MVIVLIWLVAGLLGVVIGLWAAYRLNKGIGCEAGFRLLNTRRNMCVGMLFWAFSLWYSFSENIAMLVIVLAFNLLWVWYLAHKVANKQIII